jgi:hypothetical protein
MSVWIEEEERENTWFGRGTVGRLVGGCGGEAE